jgi:hypothetical protein
MEPRKAQDGTKRNQRREAQEKLRRVANAKNAKRLANELFPGEQWITFEEGIYYSPRKKTGAGTNFQGELRDAQILKEYGSTTYLVPELRSGENGVRKFDAIVDGRKMEFKNMSGSSLLTLEDHFFKARTQAPNVFLNLEESPLAKHDVISTLYGARNSEKFIAKDRFNGENGKVILRIRGQRKLIFLTTNGLQIRA